MIRFAITFLFITLILLSHCTLYNIATETSTFSDGDKPKKNEGIVVFRFISDRKTPLPNEITFHAVGDKKNMMHFTPTAWVNKFDVRRYITLKKGTYTFTYMEYKFEEKIQGFSFPQNEFKVDPNRINYIGDIHILYSRKSVKVHSEDNMKNSMWDFYKNYPKASVKYPRVKNIIKIVQPLHSFLEETL